MKIDDYLKESGALAFVKNGYTGSMLMYTRGLWRVLYRADSGEMTQCEFINEEDAVAELREHRGLGERA